MSLRQMGRKFAKILKDLGGIEYPTADPEGEADRYIQVLLDVEDERVPLGRLWEENGEYVFKYEADVRDRHDIKPISAFPDISGEYRRSILFPFFAVRIPPTERTDVKEALKRQGINPNDTLRVLGVLGRRSPTSPYIFEYHDNSRRREGGGMASRPVTARAAAGA